MVVESPGELPGLSVTSRLSFLQPYLHTDRILANVAATKWRLSNHLPDRRAGIRILEQEVFECRLREQAIDHAQAHSSNSATDIFRRGITPQVDDQGGTAQLQHAMQLSDRLNRLGEI